MITIECTWCDAELALDSVETTSLDCPDCRITVEIAPDREAIAIAA
jgi:Zn finger protein HypA/HybF involved in hydrogenase expression